MSIKKITMDQQGTIKENQYGGMSKTKINPWRYQSSTTKKRIPRGNHNQNGGGKATFGYHVHISLGWMDARAWYQLTTMLSRSYYMASFHFSRTKYAKGDGM
jgi:hypothetical protein